MSWLSALTPKAVAPPAPTTATPAVAPAANTLSAAQSKPGGGNALASSMLAAAPPTSAACSSAPKGSWLTQSLDWLGDKVSAAPTERQQQDVIDAQRDTISQTIDQQQASVTAGANELAGTANGKVDATTKKMGDWLSAHGLGPIGGAVTGLGDLTGNAVGGAITGGNALVQGSQDVLQATTFGLPSAIHDGKSWIDDKWSAMEEFGTNLGDGIEQKVGGIWQQHKDVRNQIAEQNAQGTEAMFANGGAAIDGTLDGGAAYLDNLGEGGPAIVDKGLDGLAWLLDKGGDAAEATSNAMGTAGSSLIKADNWIAEQKDQVVQALVKDFAWGAIRGGTELIEDVAEIAVNPYGGAENIKNASSAILGTMELSSEIRDGFRYDGGSLSEEGDELVQSVKDVGMVLDELSGNDFTEGRYTEGVVSLLSNFLPWSWSAAGSKLAKIDKLSDIANLKKLEQVGEVVDNASLAQSVIEAGGTADDKNDVCEP